MKESRYIFLLGIGLGLFLGSLMDLIYNPTIMLSSIILLFVGLLIIAIGLLDYYHNKKY